MLIAQLMAKILSILRLVITKMLTTLENKSTGVVTLFLQENE